MGYMGFIWFYMGFNHFSSNKKTSYIIIDHLLSKHWLSFESTPSIHPPPLSEQLLLRLPWHSWLRVNYLRFISFTRHDPHCWWMGILGLLLQKHRLNMLEQVDVKLIVTLFVFLVGGFNPFEKYARQIGSLPQVGVKIKNIWNHQPVTFLFLIEPN